MVFFFFGGGGELKNLELKNRLIVLMTKDNGRGLYQIVELNVDRLTAKTTIFSSRQTPGYKSHPK